MESETADDRKQIAHFAGVFARPGIEADDLAQEAQLASLRASARFDPGRGASLRTYARYRVIGSMRSLVRSECRRQAHEVSSERGDLPEGTRPDGRDREPLLRDHFGESGIMLGVFHRELLMILQRAIARLTPKQRVVITMRYQQGQPFTEIAKALGVACSTAWNYHDQALETLKTILMAYGLNSGRGFS